MNIQTIQGVLNDLPPTYKRSDATYGQWIDALTNGLYRETNAADGIEFQVAQFSNAQYGWLDIWGLLIGIPRLAMESDVSYLARIAYIALAGGGPPVAIANWILKVWGVTATVTESSGSYTIALPASVTSAQAQSIIVSLSRIRPAGVPFTVGYQSGAGPYLNTINFLNAGRVTGAYLGGSADSTVTLGNICTTNSAQPLLPQLFLVDPALNP